MLVPLFNNIKFIKQIKKHFIYKNKLINYNFKGNRVS